MVCKGKSHENMDEMDENWGPRKPRYGSNEWMNGDRTRQNGFGAANEHGDD